MPGRRLFAAPLVGAAGAVVDDVAVSEREVGEVSASGAEGDVRGLGGSTRARMLLVIALAVLLADLATKILAVTRLDPGKPVYLIGDQIRLSLIRNPGAAFSMATGMTWILTIVAVGVVIGIVRYGRRLTSPWWALGLGLVLGGAVGNLIDRFFRAPGPFQGHVVDFFAVGNFPVFNIADSAITVGAILLVGLTLFGVEPTAEKAGGANPTNDSGTGETDD